MTDHNRRVLIGAGITAGVVYYLSSRQTLSAATRRALPRVVPSTTRRPSTGVPRVMMPSTTSSNPLANLLKDLFKPGGGAGLSGGGGSGTGGGGSSRGDSNAGISAGGDRRAGYVAGPGTPGYVSPTGTLDIAPGGDYGPSGIVVDYQQQVETLAAQLDNFGPSNADLLASVYADIDAAGDPPLGSRQLFYTPEDGIDAPISDLPVYLAPDLGSGDSSGLLAAARGDVIESGDVGSTDSYIGDPGAVSQYWGGSPNDSGFDDGFLSVDAGMLMQPGPADLGAVDPGSFFGSEPVIDSWAGNADYGGGDQYIDYGAADYSYVDPSQTGGYYDPNVEGWY